MGDFAANQAIESAGLPDIRRPMIATLGSFASEFIATLEN